MRIHRVRNTAEACRKLRRNKVEVDGHESENSKVISISHIANDGKLFLCEWCHKWRPAEKLYNWTGFEDMVGPICTPCVSKVKENRKARNYII